MSVVIVNCLPRLFYPSLNQRRETKAINHSARDSRRLTRTVSTAWSYKARYVNICWHNERHSSLTLHFYIHSLDFPTATFYNKVKFFLSCFWNNVIIIIFYSFLSKWCYDLTGLKPLLYREHATYKFSSYSSQRNVTLKEDFATFYVTVFPPVYPGLL